MSTFFRQTDRKYANTARYESATADALCELDSAISAIGINQRAMSSNKHNDLLVALTRLNTAVLSFCDPSSRRDEDYTYSIRDYGCWDCSVANLLKELNVKVICAQGRRGISPDPCTVVQALHNWQLFGPTGFAYDLIHDPVCVITAGKIVLTLRRDFGKDPRPISESGLKAAHERLKANFPGSSGILVCTGGHPMLDSNRRKTETDNSHWGYLSSCAEWEAAYQDPSSENGVPRWISEKLIYGFDVYMAQSASDELFSSMTEKRFSQ